MPVHYLSMQNEANAFDCKKTHRDTSMFSYKNCRPTDLLGQYSTETYKNCEKVAL